MTFHATLPPPPAARDQMPEISFSCRTRLTGRECAGLILPLSIQRHLFGCDVSGWSAGVLVGTDADALAGVLTVWEGAGPRALVCQPLVKGTVLVRFWADPAVMAPGSWTGACEVMSATSRSVVLRLPEAPLQPCRETGLAGPVGGVWLPRPDEQPQENTMNSTATIASAAKRSFVESEDGETFVGEVEICELPDGERWHAFIATDRGMVILSASNVRLIQPIEVD